MRLILRGLLLTAPLWLAAGCLSTKGKPKAAKPAKLTPFPAGNAAIGTPSAMRSQKPEPPPVVALPPNTLADGDVAVKVVAYVNNMPIFESELQEGVVLRMRELADLAESERERKFKEIRAAELEKLIDREVILDAAYARLKKMPAKIVEDLQREAGKEFDSRIKQMKEAYKFKTDEQLNAFLAQQGMSLPNFRRSMERNFIAMEYMRNLIFPKLQHIPLVEVRAYYEQHAEEFMEKDRAKWQDIFIDAAKFPDRGAARNYAIQVAGSLRNGSDFAATSRQLQEAGYNILLGPEGIGEKPGEIKPSELEAAVFALPPGQIGGPVEVAGGFHVIKVTERGRAGKRPLDGDTQTEIRNKLQNLLAAKEYRHMVEAMREKAIIQRLQ